MNKGLEALKEIEKELSEYYCCDIAYYPEIFEKFRTIGKVLQALEIIKDKLIVEDKGKYIQVVCEFSIPSKSKNYDLLKEVLL